MVRGVVNYRLSVPHDSPFERIAAICGAKNCSAHRQDTAHIGQTEVPAPSIQQSVESILYSDNFSCVFKNGGFYDRPYYRVQAWTIATPSQHANSLAHTRLLADFE